MLEAIGFTIAFIFMLFVGLLGLAGFLILVVFLVGVPLAFIVRMFMPDPLD